MSPSREEIQDSYKRFQKLNEDVPGLKGKWKNLRKNRDISEYIFKEIEEYRKKLEVDREQENIREWLIDFEGKVQPLIINLMDTEKENRCITEVFKALGNQPQNVEIFEMLKEKLKNLKELPQAVDWFQNLKNNIKILQEMNSHINKISQNLINIIQYAEEIRQCMMEPQSQDEISEGINAERQSQKDENSNSLEDS